MKKPWWKFWSPGSGPVGGAIAGTLAALTFCLVVYFLGGSHG